MRMTLAKADHTVMNESACLQAFLHFAAGVELFPVPMHLLKLRSHFSDDDHARSLPDGTMAWKRLKTIRLEVSCL